MKFLVDSLPYYGEYCYFDMLDCPLAGDDRCPRLWSKDKVTFEGNPRECVWLKEIECDGE